MGIHFFGLLLSAALSFATTFDQSTYPKNPDPGLTPGSFCERPDSYRYPEKIPYCQRDVDSDEKRRVIKEYRDRLGYDIKPEDRQQFKIDHLIPLCMGGSNERDNLWPQHQTVYVITDPLEGLACEKMAMGRLKQKRAVEMLMRAKNHLEEAGAIEDELRSL